MFAIREERFVQSPSRLPSRLSLPSLSAPFLAPDALSCRTYRDYCLQEDFMKAVRKMQDAKKHETKMDYSAV